MARLDAAFYAQPALTMAPALVGKLLCRRTEAGVSRLRITETECYYGEEDSACHAHRGKTPRNSMLYLPGGIAYVYLCYGIHSLLNVVSGPEGHPEAVLLRGAAGFPGPGRLTRGLEIDRSLNGEDLLLSKELWIEDDGFQTRVEAFPRIGIDYAEEPYRSVPWRYAMAEGGAAGSQRKRRDAL